MWGVVVAGFVLALPGCDLYFGDHPKAVGEDANRTVANDAIGSRADAVIDGASDGAVCANMPDAALDLCASAMEVDLDGSLASNGTTVTVDTCGGFNFVGCGSNTCLQTAVLVVVTTGNSPYFAYFVESSAQLLPLNVVCTGCPEAGGSPQSGCGFNVAGGLQVQGTCNLAVQLASGCGSVSVQFRGFAGL